MSRQPVYKIHSLSEILTDDTIDAFHHKEILRQEGDALLLASGEYGCHDMTIVREYTSMDDYGAGSEAVEFLNESLKAQAESSSGVESKAVVLTAMDYLLYALLRNETCKGLSENHAKCLDRLQAILDRTYEFGPVSCSRLVCYAFGSTSCGMHNRKADLDICIDGKIDDAPKNTWDGVGEEGRLADVARFSKQKFLHELADSLISSAVAKDLERIIYARVPVFHYTDSVTGVHCDVIVGGESFRFKSTILAILGSIDSKYLALVRLVKLWAEHHGLVDAPHGMLNSYTLKLLVLFHLQTRPVPVLPRLDVVPLAEGGSHRPIENDGDQSLSRFRERMRRYIKEFQSYAVDFVKDRESGKRSRNRETLSELFVTFVRFVKHFTGLQKDFYTNKYPGFDPDDILFVMPKSPHSSDSDSLPPMPRTIRTDSLMQNLRIDCWDAAFTYEYDMDTYRAYHLYIRDPFEMEPDNAARSLSLAGERMLHSVASSFCEAFDAAVSRDVGEEQIAHVFKSAFGGDVYEKSNETWKRMIHQPMDLSDILQPLVTRASFDCLLGITESELRQLQALNVMNFENM
eukprot:jgi/Picre1/29026/NNA_004420.t1